MFCDDGGDLHERDGLLIFPSQFVHYHVMTVMDPGLVNVVEMGDGMLYSLPQTKLR